jgi:hypothetical protein
MFGLVVGDDVERGEPGEGGQDPGRDGGEAEWSGQRAVGQGDRDGGDGDGWQQGRVGLVEEAGWYRTSMTASSVRVDSMNQPLRDRVALAWNPRRRVRKLRMSNTGLSRPKTIMKVRMDRSSSCSGSTLPGQ